MRTRVLWGAAVSGLGCGQGLVLVEGRMGLSGIANESHYFIVPRGLMHIRILVQRKTE